MVSDACRRLGAAHEADNSYSISITGKIAATTNKSLRAKRRTSKLDRKQQRICIAEDKHSSVGGSKVTFGRTANKQQNIWDKTKIGSRPGNRKQSLIQDTVVDTREQSHQSDRRRWTRKGYEAGGSKLTLRVVDTEKRNEATQLDCHIRVKT